MLKNSILFILILSLLCLLSSSSCIWFKEKIRVSKELDLRDGKIILENFFKIHNQIFETLKSRAKVTYMDDKGKYKFDSLILLKMPDNMRIEILNVFDQPLLILNYSREELFIYSVL